MGYILLPTIVPKLVKGTVSIWARVPRESFAACLAAPGDNNDPFHGTIPILCIGKPGEYNDIDTPNPGSVPRRISSSSTGSFGDSSHTEMGRRREVDPSINPPPPAAQFESIIITYNDTTWFSSGPSESVDSLERLFYGEPVLGEKHVIEPTYIGVSPSSGDEGWVVANIETGLRAKIKNAGWRTVGAQSGTADATGGSGFHSITYDAYNFIVHYKDVTLNESSGGTPYSSTETSPHYDWADRSDIVFNDTQSIDIGNSTDKSPKVKSDHWFHIILSWDLSNGIKTHGIKDDSDNNFVNGVDKAVKVYLAVDDKNYTKKDLSTEWPQGSSSTNDVITDDAGRVIGYGDGINPNVSVGGDGLNESPPDGLPTYDLSKVSVPEGKPGVPAFAQFVENIYRVETAELQIFDKVMDTGVVLNRRVFITNDPTAKITQRPTKMSEAKDFFGVEPLVKEHGSGNWKRARNTGSLAANPVQDGTSQGDIETWKPNPSLDGPQSPP